MHRRHFHRALAAVIAGLATPASARPATSDMATALATIEGSSGGRLGVAILDTKTDRVVARRGDERFPMCSTFKLMAAALTLRRVDRGLEQLDRRVRFAEADLVPYSPLTEGHVGGDGMTIDALCHAAVTVSDNTAANLLLASFGGPAGLTAFARAIGDPSTRLDRTEPSLNEARANDPRDTTTPRAMAHSVQAIVLGDVLSAASRGRMKTWLVGSTTGARRLRAGLPTDWEVGDKTGTGSRGTTNDLAIVWPPGRAPIVIAAYLTGSGAPAAARESALANVGRIAARRA